MGWKQILLSLKPKESLKNLKQILFNEKFTKGSNKWGKLNKNLLPTSFLLNPLKIKFSLI